MKIIYFVAAIFVHVHVHADLIDDLSNATKTVSSNITVAGADAQLLVERITQPSRSVEPPERVEKAVHANASFLKSQEFRPSPQLETYFEHNETPVVPAFPEAKRFFVGGEENSPTTNKIRFPAPGRQDHPYAFVVGHGDGKIQVDEKTQVNDYPPRKAIGSVSPPIYLDNSIRFPIAGSIDKFESGYAAPFGPMKYNYDLEEKKPHAVGNSFPWKNVAKFLTAAIPIGILISALTPNVINVTPMNVTQNRVRLDENESRTKTRSANWKQQRPDDSETRGCEERILCVLLIGAASSKRGVDHAENFLRLFTERESPMVKKSEKLKKLMEAVRKGNCNDFVCKKMAKMK